MIVALGVPFAAAATLCCGIVAGAAHLAAGVPGAAVAAPSFSGAWVAAYYAGMGVAVAGPRLARRTGPRQRAVAVALGLASATGILALAGRPDGRLHVHFLGGVSGTAVLVVAPDGATLLLDTGSSAPALRPALDAALPLATSLPGLPRRLDAVVLGGSSSAEAGGLAALSAYSVGHLLLPADLPGQAAAAGAADLSTRGTAVLQLRAGERWGWHQLTLLTDDVGVGGMLAIVIQYGSNQLLIADASTATVAPVLPRGTYAAVAAGTGTGDLVDDGVSTALLLLQPATGRARTRLLLQRYGARAHRTDHEGAIELLCDTGSCEQAPPFPAPELPQWRRDSGSGFTTAARRTSWTGVGADLAAPDRRADVRARPRAARPAREC